MIGVNINAFGSTTNLTVNGQSCNKIASYVANKFNKSCWYLEDTDTKKLPMIILVT